MGFVIKINNYQKMYVLICNYLFLRENEQVCIRYLVKVVVCVFIIKIKGCGFVVDEIKECYLIFCDVVFVKDNKKEINVNFYFNSV